MHIPVDLDQYAGIKQHAASSGRTIADHVRFVLAAAAGFPYRRLRGGRPLAPWVVVRDDEHGRGIITKHQTEEAALADVRLGEQVMSRDEYEKEVR